MKTLLSAALFLLFSFISFAAKDARKALDLDKDGRVDRYEYYAGEELVRIDEDRDGDGSVDFKTLFTDGQSYLIQFQDLDGDGNFDRRQTFSRLNVHKNLVLTELDRNADGKFEISYQSVNDSVQKDEDCDLPVILKMSNFSDDALDIVAKSRNGFIPSGVGYLVDRSCYKKWGRDFHKYVEESMKVGLKCLKDQDAEYKKAGGKAPLSGAGKNAYDLERLKKDDAIKLLCSEDNGQCGNDFKFGPNTMACASTHKSQKTKAMGGVKHPFVSINPKMSIQGLEEPEAGLKELKMTLFHETLHNLGIEHQESIEFAYSCEVCCFTEDSQQDGELKTSACKICRGDYKNETDPEYVKEFINFARLNQMDALGAKVVQKYLKENERDASGLAMLAFTQSDTFGAVGPELSKLISAKGLKVSGEDKKLLKDALKYDGKPWLEGTGTSSKVLAQAIFDMYHERDSSKVMQALEKNKFAIKAEILALEAKEQGAYKRVAANLRKVVDNLILELQVNKFPDGKHWMKAGDLDTYFNR